MLKMIHDSIIPSQCLLCGSFEDVNYGLCSSCMSQIRPVPSPVCDICGKPIGSPGVCISCQAFRPEFDNMLAAACFEGLLKDIIHLFKYQRKSIFKKILARILYESLSNMDMDIDVISFVPLHWTRLIERGYNQSALIAKELSRYMGVKIRYNILKKIKRSIPQVGLDQKARAKNVKGTFRASDVKGKSVMIVDDVITTGATGKEVARALKDAGALYVIFAGVGRTIS
jgi:ComF family protein